MDIEFRSNKDLRLIENAFSLYGHFADAEGDVTAGGDEYRQVQAQDAVGLRNAVSMVRKRKNWKWRLKSDLQYSESPEGTLDISVGDEALALQYAKAVCLSRASGSIPATKYCPV